MICERCTHEHTAGDDAACLVINCGCDVALVRMDVVEELWVKWGGDERFLEELRGDL